MPQNVYTANSSCWHWNECKIIMTSEDNFICTRCFPFISAVLKIDSRTLHERTRRVVACEIRRTAFAGKYLYCVNNSNDDKPTKRSHYAIPRQLCLNKGRKKSVHHIYFVCLCIILIILTLIIVNSINKKTYRNYDWPRSIITTTKLFSAKLHLNSLWKNTRN